MIKNIRKRWAMMTMIMSSTILMKYVILFIYFAFYLFCLNYIMGS
jgi:hypothetical protein